MAKGKTKLTTKMKAIAAELEKSEVKLSELEEIKNSAKAIIEVANRIYIEAYDREAQELLDKKDNFLKD